MDKKKKCLIKHIIELGKFFMECDGNVDDREIKFIKDYTDQMVAHKRSHSGRNEDYCKFC